MGFCLFVSDFLADWFACRLNVQLVCLVVAEIYKDQPKLGWCMASNESLLLLLGRGAFTYTQTQKRTTIGESVGAVHTSHLLPMQRNNVISKYS